MKYKLEKREKNEAKIKLYWLKTLTSGSDTLLVSAEMNAHPKIQKEASKDPERDLQKNIQYLQEEVDASVSTKLNALFEPERENVSFSSHESDEVAIKPRQELQEYKKEKMDAKLVADAKMETFGKELVANQDQNYTGDRKGQYLIDTLQSQKEKV